MAIDLTRLMFYADLLRSVLLMIGKNNGNF
jgi:hypothetical protein